MSDTSRIDKVIEIVRRQHDNISDEHMIDILAIADQAAAELAELRAENTEMRETLADLVVMIADFAHLLPQGAKIAFENAAAVLAKHPEEKK